MNEDRESALKFYSQGIILRDKAEDSDTVIVDPIEDLPMDNGVIKTDDRKYDVELPDHRGVKKKSKMTGGSGINATWLPIGNANRMDAPMVRAGETVAIYRYSNTDKYYWDTIGREPKLRRLEKRLIALSNRPSPDDVEFNLKTSYWVLMDTINKKIHLHTAKNDGEPVEFDVFIDTKMGTFTVKDDRGNFLKLDSPKDILSGNINERIQLKTKHLEIIATETMKFTTKVWEALASVSFFTKTKTHSTEASDSSTTKSPKIKDDGNLSVTKGMNVVGADGGATMNISGEVAVQGSVTATGRIMDGGGNSNHHSH